ncbi:TPA: fimbrial protein [Escherichia coli]|nr:fimbrial protein [Escherichia coli]MCN2441944.1 fimbrial protein [Escherichia coli]MCN4958035.1 fimbrial protein [Escherichia coli]HBA7664128.1 fimbrial protein [Escherichia coli]HBA8910688.1 fimbrial protein [Escherichia coli]
MWRMLFAIIAIFFSSNYAYAKNCTDGEIYVVYDYSTPVYYTYDSSQTGPVASLGVDVYQQFQCEPDYLDEVHFKGMSYLSFPITNGGTCSNNVITTSEPGVVWQLEGLSCDARSGFVRTTTELETNPQGKVNWSGHLGRFILTLTDEFWKKNTDAQKILNLKVPTQGYVNGTTNVKLTASVTNLTHTITHSGTCTFSVSPENVSFGTISPLDINKGTVSKDVNVYWNCINQAIAAHGLSFRLNPEHVLDANQGTFRAIADDGKSLNFKIVRYSSGTGRVETSIPINSNAPVYASTIGNANGVLYLGVKVLPSSRYPTGTVSTFLTITAIYR